MGRERGGGGLAVPGRRGGGVAFPSKGVPRDELQGRQPRAEDIQ